MGSSSKRVTVSLKDDSVWNIDVKEDFDIAPLWKELTFEDISWVGIQGINGWLIVAPAQIRAIEIVG